MNDYFEQAMVKAREFVELDGLIDHPIYESEPGDEQKADRLWQEHVELLRKVYLKPDPQDHIQVTILDKYRDDAFVLNTSFSDMKSYNKAAEQLGWDYELESEQVGICELCSEQYLVKEGCQDRDGRGFCKQGCLEEDEFERQMPTDDGEYDLFYDYYFPDGDIYDRERPNW